MSAGGRPAVVVIGGGKPHPGVAAQLPPGALVVAADSGLEHAAGLGLRVDVVVGDLDSVDPAALAAAEAAGVGVDRHPAAKDATDTELALDRALALGATALTLVSGGGDRLDHLLGVLGALADRRFAGVATEAWVGRAWAGVVHADHRIEVTGGPGDYVSLIPIGGAAVGVVTTGLRWALAGDTLSPTSTRGVSNEMEATSATVALVDGILLVIRPYALP